MAEELYEEEEENGIKSLIPKPLELLPELEEEIQPKFAIEGLSLLSTDCKFRSLEEICQISTQKASSSIINLNTKVDKNPFKDTIYQKYEGFDTASCNQKCIIRCSMNRIGDSPPLISNQLVSNTSASQKYRSVRFDSLFESGNLGRVSRVSQYEYNLLIDNDINTGGFTQWFFFKVEVDKPCRIKFNILNFRKKHSLYQRGMKICSYSQEANKKEDVSWTRSGTDIRYFKNDMHFDSNKTYYTLSFNYEFRFKLDKVYFSYHYPYTFSDLLTFYKSLKEFKFVKRSLLCQTPCKNPVHCLTITQNNPKFRLTDKKYVFFIARTHPGETISSMVIERIVNYLTSNQKQAIELRHTYIFKIVPMVNPDGVLHGNSRCSLPGRDLNRSWDKLDQYLFPEIYHIKKMILLAHRKSKVHFICDFHGHSLKKDSFIYGCHKKTSPFSTREFPWVLSKLCKNFSYNSCAFTNSTEKFGTARISLFKTLRIPNIFTLQTSFCGPNRSAFHWSQEDLKDLTKCFCLALYTLGAKPKPAVLLEKQSKAFVKEHELTEAQRQSFLSELYQNKENYQGNLRSQSSCSDVQDDYIENNFDNEDELVKNKISQPLSLGRNNRIKSETPQKFTKTRESINKVLKNQVQSQRLQKFDNIKFWADSVKMKMNQQQSQERIMNIEGKRRAFYSRTQVEEPQLKRVVSPKTNQIKFEFQKTRFRKTPEKYKCKEVLINREVIIVRRQKRNSKKSSSVNILSECVERLPKKYFVQTSQLAPQQIYEKLNSRTQLLKKRGSAFQSNMIEEHRVFEKDLINKIDRRLQNYIEVHKLNRFHEGPPKYQ